WPAPAQEPPKYYWRLAKIDTMADHPLPENLQKGMAYAPQPDGSIMRTTLPDKGLRGVGAVWRVWPKEGRASYTGPKGEGSLEVTWTVPPPVLTRDQDFRLAVSVVARGNVWGGGQWWDRPVEAFIHNQQSIVGSDPFGQVQAGQASTGTFPTASGS